MQIPLIQIDAFAEKLFEGNPAAVMPLPQWLPDELLQQLAAENNLSETAFLVADLPAEAARTRPTGGAPAYHLRWFTPAIEVDLCGHATLATAGYLFDDVHPDFDRIDFWTRSGWVTAERTEQQSQVRLDFPGEDLVPCEIDESVATALGVRPQAAFAATDLVFLAADADEVRALRPDHSILQGLDVRGVIVTAPGDSVGVDFVSRWFGAGAGIGEDPVTGSGHSQLAPYWGRVLGRTTLTGRQLSARGGTVECELSGDRVLMTGGYQRYLEATVRLPG